MSIRGIIDGSFTVSSTAASIETFTVSTTNTSPIINVSLTFFLNGSMCTLVIDSFSASTTSNVLLDMSNPGIAKYLPKNTIRQTVVINNGDGKVNGYVNWNTATGVFSITTLSTGSGDIIGLDDAQSINYIIG